MTGGRSFSFAGSTSSHSTCFVEIGSGVASSSAGAMTSSSARVSKPSSFATRLAVSKSTDWLIETIVPMFTRPRITSTTLTSSARARSPTTMVFGSVTTVDTSATATGAAGSGIGWGIGARWGRRPRGRGPRCGGIRLGLALGTRSPFLGRRRELDSQPVGGHSVDINF